MEVQSAITKLWNENKIDVTINDDVYYYNVGAYHYKVTKNYSEMEKYYLMAIEKGHSSAMNIFKTQYSNILNFNNVIKVFLKEGHYDEVSSIINKYTRALTTQVMRMTYPYLDKIEIPNGLKSVIRTYNRQQRHIEVNILKKDIPWNVRRMIRNY